MRQFQRAEPPIFQKIKPKMGHESQLLPAYICPTTDRRCIFWQDLENIYPGVDYVYLQHSWTDPKRILFMVDQYGEVYV